MAYLSVARVAITDGGVATTDDAPYEHPLTKGSDALEAAGFLVNDNNNGAPLADGLVRITRSGNDLQLSDITVGTRTLSQLVALRTLTHVAENGPFEGFGSPLVRVMTGGAFPTQITWYADAAKTKRIVQKTITYLANKRPSQVQWQVFASDGATVLATATDAMTYNGFFEVSRTRTLA